VTGCYLRGLGGVRIREPDPGQAPADASIASPPPHGNEPRGRPEDGAAEPAYATGTPVPGEAPGAAAYRTITLRARSSCWSDTPNSARTPPWTASASGSAGTAYSVLRHPSYTAILLILAGIGISYGNWLSLAALIFLPLIGFINRIHLEEAALSAT